MLFSKKNFKNFLGSICLITVFGCGGGSQEATYNAGTNELIIDSKCMIFGQETPVVACLAGTDKCFTFEQRLKKYEKITVTLPDDNIYEIYGSDLFSGFYRCQAKRGDTIVVTQKDRGVGYCVCENQTAKP